MSKKIISLSFFLFGLCLFLFAQNDSGDYSANNSPSLYGHHGRDLADFMLKNPQAGMKMVNDDINKGQNDSGASQAILYNLQGALATLQGDMNSGLESCNKAIASVAADASSQPYQIASVYDNRAKMYLMMKDYAHAKVDIDKAISIDSDLSSLYYTRSDVYVALEDYDKALEDLNFVINKGEQSRWMSDKPAGWLYGKRADVYFKLGRYREAIEDYNKHIAEFPDLKLLYYSRGQAYFYLQDYNHAWTDINKARELGFTVPADFLEKLKQASGRER